MVTVILSDAVPVQYTDKITYDVWYIHYVSKKAPTLKLYSSKL